jgi:C1A family cysteine protease
VYDQLHLNSCSANALAAALRYDELKEGLREVPEPSRLFIYFNERVVANVVDRDAPVSLRDGYRTIAKVGACPERMWPYEPRRFKRPPTAGCYEAATRHKAIEYFRIRRLLSHLRGCLAERFPFVFGLAVHKSMFHRPTRQTGVVSVPSRHDKVVGGHAVMAVGYDHSKRQLIFRNSWGQAWGDRGYGYLPYQFLMSATLSWDFWTMRRVS